MQEITVFGIESSAGDGAELRFEYCHKLISVSVLPSTHSSIRARSHHESRVEDRLVHLLIRATTTPDDDEHDEIVEDVLLIILKAGKAIFDDIRTNLPRIPETGLHSSVLYPEVLCLRLLTLSGELSLVPIEPRNAYADFDPDVYQDFEAENDIDADFPRYSPPASWTEEFPTGEETAWRFLTEDETMLVKDHPYGIDHDKSLSQELKRILEMRNAGFQGDIRQPQTYIGRERGIYPNRFLPQWASEDILEDMDIPSKTAERGRRWVSQAREAEDGLHDTGITWGGASNGSIIVDADEDAWVICSGRGWEELVDEELSVPMAVDELGPNRIVELSEDE